MPRGLAAVDDRDEAVAPRVGSRQHERAIRCAELRDIWLVRGGMLEPDACPLDGMALDVVDGSPNQGRSSIRAQRSLQALKFWKTGVVMRVAEFETAPP